MFLVFLRFVIDAIINRLGVSVERILFIKKKEGKMYKRYNIENIFRIRTFVRNHQD